MDVARLRLRSHRLEGYVLVVDGQIAGACRRTIAGRTVRLEVMPYRPLSRAETRAVAAATDRYARFLGGDRALALSFATRAT